MKKLTCLAILVVVMAIIGCKGEDGTNGVDGIDGTAGTSGTDGTAGADGPAGETGYSSLVKITDEAAGSNCSYGGKKIRSGLDNGDGGGTARDRVLQIGEVDSTEYVCDGEDGTTNKISKALACTGSISTILWTYNAAEMTSGDVFVSGSIYASWGAATDTRWYSVGAIGNAEAIVLPGMDVQGFNNFGFWEIEADRTTQIVTLTYNDRDLASDPAVYEQSADKCSLFAY